MSSLEIRGLDAGYGHGPVLQDVSLTVDDGEFVTIVGPNGAGKSTVIKSILGLTTITSGQIIFGDEDLTETATDEVIQTGIGYVPQNDNVFPSLTVAENLEMGGHVLASVPEERFEAVYERFPVLRERADQAAGQLSGGQQQMLAIGRALVITPELLVLDEPSAALAPDLVADVFDRIEEINDSGVSILMVEQNAKEALRRSDRGYVLVQGENRHEASGDALLADEQVRQEFLGG